MESYQTQQIESFKKPSLKIYFINFFKKFFFTEGIIFRKDIENKLDSVKRNHTEGNLIIILHHFS